MPHVAGVVTAVAKKGLLRGFWLESERADRSLATSEGVFVDTRGRPSVKAGDRVKVAGRVREIIVPRRWRSALPVTAIEMSDVTVLARGVPLPRARAITLEDSPPPSGARRPLKGELNPRTSALDFWESLEGMRVTLDMVTTIGPTSRHGDVWTLLAEYERSPRSQRGVLTASAGQRILLAGRPFGRKLELWPVGTHLHGPLTGIVSYAFGNYRVQLFEPPGTVRSKKLIKQRVRWPRSDAQLAVASYNVLNLGGDAKPDAFKARARHIAISLDGPDIVVLQEIQDNSGKRNDGVEAADITMTKLLRAIEAQGGPRYKYLQIDPQGGQDGGIPGGNIRVAMLYKPGKIKVVKSRATDPHCGDGRWHLPRNPMRIGAAAKAFADSRKPLVALFSVMGRSYLVVGVHLKSKHGDDPLAGPNQPPIAHSAPTRQAQAALIGAFVRRAMICESDLRVIVAGDMNDVPGAAPLQPLIEAGLTNLAERLLPRERYSYIYQGRAELLDQIWVSANIPIRDGAKFAVIHVNAEYPYTQRASDHDPVIMSTSIRQQ